MSQTFNGSKWSKCQYIQLLALKVFNLQSGHEIALYYWWKGNKPKNKQSRVMFLVHDTSSYCALQLYKVSFK